MLTVEIIIIGRIDREWCEWLGGSAITHPESDQTMLAGKLADQAAVMGSFPGCGIWGSRYLL
jgi:hypothetical protein